MENASKFWIQLLVYPKEFFKSHVLENKLKYFNFAIVVFCLGYGIDRLEKQLVKFEIRGILDKLEFINTWTGFWLVSLAIGAIGGYILYLIGGWFYNVRVKWSAGEGNLEKSRALYLYSNFFISLFIILDSLIETIIYPIPYDPYSYLQSFEIIAIPLLFFFIFHSIYISYAGVTTITDVKKGRAIIWFLVLPILVYLVVYIALISILYSYF
ncbi:YIP1 family protein [Robiginitalea biformata]|uniref:Yip1 domain-containing protein n=1 Tax=Robiginitalea biformata (strain ATCC BAA-864 / DSM 15991 / KCTC 12146 / HTCC2501) TaxID=313596 RepID=A4CN29_ROBBH|nr:YIP1 family protein [Robiginitalea biformata]EAR15071.1 hypothetical protein RB2501_12112 [Robiginitalea biformata HTCC2501]